MDLTPLDHSLDETASTPLPAEFVMLAGGELTASALADLAAHAQQLQVAPLRALFVSGAISALRYTMALAQFWRVPVMKAPLPLHSTTTITALSSGLARLADGRWLLSSDSSALPRLLSSTPNLSQTLVLTTPSSFRARVRHVLADAIETNASIGLAAHRPDLSYRGGPRLWQRVFGLGFLAILALIAFSPGGPAARIFLFAFALIFLAAIVIHVAVMLEPDGRSERSPPPLPDADLPIYGVLVPLHDEARVVPKLIDALNRLAYPALGSKLTRHRLV